MYIYIVLTSYTTEVAFGLLYGYNVHIRIVRCTADDVL